MSMRRKNSRCVGIGLGLLVLVLVFTSCISVSALRINEINAIGKEYVEIYNDMGEVNLDEWFIKDGSTNAPDEIICTDIPNCFLNTSAKYFLILGRSTNIREITQEEVVYFYTDDQKIGNGLNDGGDDISFYKNGFESGYKYDKAEANKSWQFCDSGWVLEAPTPGKENNCQEQEESEETQEQVEETSSNESKEKVKEEEASSHSSETIYVTGNVVNDNEEEQNQETAIGENVTKETIYLNNKNIESVIYESKTEKIKKLSIVLLGLLGIVAAFVLIRWKAR